MRFQRPSWRPALRNHTGTAQVNPPTTPQPKPSYRPNHLLPLVAFPSPQSPPHAFISFANSGTSCGSSGPLILDQPTWEVTGDGRLCRRVWLVGLRCVRGIVFTKLAPSQGCTAVKLVTQDWTA
ncbi:hypothetical protein BC629DRAFT_1562150 [Irpex lacteus]|nr:hypothetical protein BC629DRAFT_1562150 [Irpex lacteus]